jgi:hypothetical protein
MLSHYWSPLSDGIDHRVTEKGSLLEYEKHQGSDRDMTISLLFSSPFLTKEIIRSGGEMTLFSPCFLPKGKDGERMGLGLIREMARKG